MYSSFQKVSSRVSSNRSERSKGSKIATYSNKRVPSRDVSK